MARYQAGISVVIFAIIALVFQKEVFEYIIYAPKKADFITYRVFCAISEATCFNPPELPLITRELGEQFLWVLQYPYISVWWLLFLIYFMNSGNLSNLAYMTKK